VTAHNDRLLLGPGPSNPYPEAMEEFVRPVLIHLDPEYLALMADISAQLKAVFGTTNELTLPVSGTGSAGMEACLASLLAPGEKAIVRPDSRTGDCTP
jgi:alanine-glyoxylate transaminase/serine-glyoxylate transaminase/serine-pyruvate transaminase